MIRAGRFGLCLSAVLFCWDQNEARAQNFLRGDVNCNSTVVCRSDKLSIPEGDLFISLFEKKVSRPLKPSPDQRESCTRTGPLAL